MTYSGQTSSQSTTFTVCTNCLIAQSSSLSAGSLLTATWSNVNSASSHDWIGVFQQGETNSTHYRSWLYVDCSTSAGGSIPNGGCGNISTSDYNGTPLPAGNYELRLFANDTYTLLATSNGFTLTGPATGNVTINGVWTNDDGNNWATAKTVFHPGDAIRYLGAINNATGSTITAHFTWDILGPSGESIANWNGDLQTGSGSAWWGLDPALPSTAPVGRYTFTWSVAYGGQTLSQSVAFVVQSGAAGAAVQQPSPVQPASRPSSTLGAQVQTPPNPAGNAPAASPPNIQPTSPDYSPVGSGAQPPGGWSSE